MATHSQMAATASAGGRWDQLGLTITNLKSWANMVGTAPVASAANRLSMDSLRMFDGGTQALSAVNVYGYARQQSTG